MWTVYDPLTKPAAPNAFGEIGLASAESTEAGKPALTTDRKLWFLLETATRHSRRRPAHQG